MSLRVGSIATALIIAAGGFSGCGSRSDPAKPFADAEVLRGQYQKGASQLAIARYREAQATWTQSGNTRDAARAAQGIGATYEQLGALPASLAAYREALTLAGSSADRILESEIRSDVGTALSLVADGEAMFDEAESQCDTALALARQHGSDGGAAKALSCRGDAAYYRQRPEQALQFYRESGDGWVKIGDRRGQAQTLLLQGQVYSDLSRFAESRDCYERSRVLWEIARDKRQLAIVLVSDARLLMRMGEYQQALNKFEQALPWLQSMGDAQWEGGSLAGIASIHLDLGETELALKHWERALEIFETAGNKNVAVDMLMSLGGAYLATGDSATALNRFERALTLSHVQGIARWETLALRFIGVVHLFRRDPNLAEQYLQRSLTAQHAPGAPADARLEGQTRADLAEASELRGHHDAALGYFTGALGLSRAAGDRVTEARALYGLARTSVGRDDLDAARRYVEGALQVAESLRTDVDNRDLRTSFSASVHQWHELHLDVLMQLARRRSNPALATAAFEASERARARSLLESLTDAAVDVRAGIDADLMKQQQVLDRAFTEWAGRSRQAVASGSNGSATAMAEEYRDLEYRSSQLQALIRSRNPAYAALTRPPSVSLQEVQRQLLDEHTMLLEYSLGEERSYLWVVSKTDRRSYALPPRAEIERSAQRVYERLTARLTATGDGAERDRQIARADAEYWPEAARLSAMLLQPVAAAMAGKRLLLVTDGALQSLPFGALPVPGARDMVPMVVEHEIVNLPSASVLAVLRRDTGRRTPPMKTVAVLADPVFERDDPRLPLATGAVLQPVTPASSRADARGAANPSGQPTRSLRITRDGVSSIPRLTSTRQEAADIVAAAGDGASFKALDFDASRATAMGPELANYRIVHFAAHGVLNNDEPGLSGIILSMFDRGGQPQDGFLRLRDIYGLKLPVDLVVLSACSTALGKPVRGEGVVGMVRGFMYAGAKRVVASYWRVDDEATGDLMRLFYGEMLARHRSPASALRQAQLAMLRQDRWTPPFYWAAFVLQGEWK